MREPVQEREEGRHGVDDGGGHGGLGDEHGGGEEQAEEGVRREGEHQAAQAEEARQQVELLPRSQRAGRQRGASREQAQPHGAWQRSGRKSAKHGRGCMATS